MRVIAGKARRLPLKTAAGLDTRPTTDRIKETLFNILQSDLYGIRFLDLFAGSGGIGIEALSRGAAQACFVDSSSAAVRCIRENLSFTHLENQAEVLMCDVLTGLTRLEGASPFQIVFMDPPYDRGLERKVLEAFSERRPSFVDSRTLFIVEASLGTDFDYAKQLGFEVLRIKKYKTNMHVFLHMQEKEHL